MFTGIVSAIGTVASREESAAGCAFGVAAPWGDLQLGESIAVNGACLTVAAIQADGFAVDVVATTLARTTIGEWHAGKRVNLERAVAAGERFGGHFVQGHVDAVGRVHSLEQGGPGYRLRLAIPDAIRQLCAPLGSIAIDGVSLTVNDLGPTWLEVSLVPFTLAHTTLGELQPGDGVHLEADMIARYVAAQLADRSRH